MVAAVADTHLVAVDILSVAAAIPSGDLEAVAGTASLAADIHSVDSAAAVIRMAAVIPVSSGDSVVTRLPASRPVDLAGILSAKQDARNPGTRFHGQRRSKTATAVSATLPMAFRSGWALGLDVRAWNMPSRKLSVSTA